MACTKVELFGLKAARNLNGKVGSLGQLHPEKQRTEVLFEDGFSKLVKFDNLRLLRAETYTNCNIVALCAVHFDDLSRLAGLDNCLRTIRQQMSPPDLLLIGWSARDTNTRKAVAEFFQEMVETKVLHDQPSGVSDRLSQFQHFQHLLHDPRLSALASNGKPTWIVFSDDDDLWHRERVHSYRYVIETMANLPNDRSVRSKKHAQPCTDVVECASSALQAELMLWQGRAQRVGEDDDREEYFDFAVRLDLMQDFFKWVSNGLLTHKFCVRALCYFLSLSDQESVFFDPACWMYFYNRPMSGGSLSDALLSDTVRSKHLSARVDPSPEDQEVAIEAVRHGLLVSAPHSTPAKDVFCARSNLEFYLIESYLGKAITSQAVNKLAHDMSKDLRRFNGCDAKPTFLTNLVCKSCEAFGIQVTS